LQSTREHERPNGDILPKLEPHFEAGAPERLANLRKTLADLRKDPPIKGVEFAMTLADSPNPHNVRVFRRGNPGNQGDEAPRRFLQICRPNSGPNGNRAAAGSNLPAPLPANPIR
jgi:hypothetical protein